MDIDEFDYDLPPELIAQAPAPERTGSRLLHLDPATGSVRDLRFADLARLLRPGDLLVVNDTRVIPARLAGRKATGGRVEVLVERVLDERRLLAQVRASKALRPGGRLELAGAAATVLARHDDLFELRVDEGPAAADLLERHGAVPLPPYIERAPGPEDAERYQTVYAREPGAVAAPTAGLHFDESMLGRLRAQGVELARVTLHVGAGTFQPVRVRRIEEHRLHAERAVVPAAAAQAVARARARGARVLAVGTTTVRALEAAAAATGRVAPFAGETDLFIRPGHRFRAVDALLTNFHLPRSTLLVLVCAFAGTAKTLAAYRHAVRERYRFFSYGDAMLIATGARDR